MRPRALAASICSSVNSTMYRVPSLQHRRLPLANDAHCLPEVTRPEPIVTDQLRQPIAPRQIDLRRTVANHVDMGRLVIVGEDNEAQPSFTMQSDHLSNNLSGWVFKIALPEHCSLPRDRAPTCGRGGRSPEPHEASHRRTVSCPISRPSAKSASARASASSSARASLRSNKERSCATTRKYKTTEGASIAPAGNRVRFGPTGSLPPNPVETLSRIAATPRPR